MAGCNTKAGLNEMQDSWFIDSKRAKLPLRVTWRMHGDRVAASWSHGKRLKDGKQGEVGRVSWAPCGLANWNNFQCSWHWVRP